MSANNTYAQTACCAHLDVRYMTRELSVGGTLGWWACADCNMRFAPLGIAGEPEVPEMFRVSPVPECTRGTGHDGPCNGWPRPECVSRPTISRRRT